MPSGCIHNRLTQNWKDDVLKTQDKFAAPSSISSAENLTKVNATDCFHITLFPFHAPAGQREPVSDRVRGGGVRGMDQEISLRDLTTVRNLIFKAVNHVRRPADPQRITSLRCVVARVATISGARPVCLPYLDASSENRR